jgi:hypothetical protein
VCVAITQLPPNNKSGSHSILLDKSLSTVCGVSKALRLLQQGFVVVLHVDHWDFECIQCNPGDIAKGIHFRLHCLYAMMNVCIQFCCFTYMFLPSPNMSKTSLTGIPSRSPVVKHTEHFSKCSLANCTALGLISRSLMNCCVAVAFFDFAAILSDILLRCFLSCGCSSFNCCSNKSMRCACQKT